MDAPFPAGMVEDIESFLRHEHPGLPAGRDIYHAVFDRPLMFPLQRKAELAWMMRKAREVAPASVMEIGSDKGGGFYHWLKCLPTVRNAVACEVRGIPWQRAFAHAFPEVQFAWLERESLPPPDFPQGSLDVLFIDGDKGRFWEDFVAYRPLMSPAGRVFFHDVNGASPMREAFLRASSQHHGELFINTDDWKFQASLEARGVGPSSAWEGWVRHWKGSSCGVGMIDLARNADGTVRPEAQGPLGERAAAFARDRERGPRKQGPAGRKSDR